MTNMKQALVDVCGTLEMLQIQSTYDNLNRLLGCIQVLRAVAGEIPDNMTEIMDELERLRREHQQRAGGASGDSARAPLEADAPGAETSGRPRAAGSAPGGSGPQRDAEARSGRTVMKIMDRETMDRMEDMSDE